MKRVYKYPLRIDDVTKVSMPKGAVILTLQTQRDEPCVWALVDPGAPSVWRGFRIAGTGHDIQEFHCLKHVGSFQMRGGMLVFHVFDLGEEAEATA